MNLESAADYLKQNQNQILDLVIRLAEINSGSFNTEGLHKVAEILKQEFAQLNCQHIIMPVAPLKFINNKGIEEQLPLGPVLRFWKRPEAQTQVLLVGHMDTVYPHTHKFQKVVQSSNDILNGPGVADMKGGLAILLWALKAFEQLPEANKLGWEVIISSDEEIGSPGSAEIIENRAKKHNLGFVFEPAMDENGTLAGQRKGSGKFTIVIRGQSAHAGRHFEQGRNAICKMSEVICKINALNGKRPGVTINVGLINGGEALNIVPDCCVCNIDVRIPNNIDADWVDNNFNEILAEIDQEAGYKYEIYGSFDRKPKNLNEDMEKLYSLVQSIGKNLGQDLHWKPSGGCCDGNNMAAVGLPNVDTLGARGGKIHSEQEYIIISSLPERALLLTNILTYLSENGFRL